MGLVVLPGASGLPSREIAFFRRSVPDSLLQAILRVVCDGCTAAYDAVRKDVARDFFNDAIPTYRRVRVEPGLVGLVHLPPGFTTSLRKTTTTTYTEILSESVAITAMSRSQEVKRIDVAVYREMLARSRQTAFPFMGQSEFIPTNGLYGILLYGGPHSRRVPSMARIAFPMEDGFFMPDEINLIREFHDIISSYEERGGEDFGLRTPDEETGEG